MKFLGYEIKRHKKLPPKTKPTDITKEQKVVALPAGRVSIANDLFTDGGFQTIKNGLTIVKPKFYFEFIPVLRSLYKYNGDVGSVVNDLVQLTNTGHTIKFDQSMDAAMVEKMREHLIIRRKGWGHGVAGLEGLINKMITQLWVAGAISVESYPDYRLTEVDNVSLINPETIRFSILRNGKYAPYQKVDRILKVKSEYIKLNTKTYQYYGLIGDEDSPYGVPPFLTALADLSTQKDMKANLVHIMNQLGLLGYLEVLMDKPHQEANESVSAYTARLERLLKDAKTNVLAGFKEGVVTGYDGDHDFEFHSTTKNLSGVGDLFNMNQVQIANGLKTHPSFLGIDSGGTEGQLGIVFTKMLSQLTNVQNIVKHVLEHIYRLELTLAGFDFKGLVVEFKPSTITDDLKNQQAREIKQRVCHNLWIDRIIDAHQYADEMGYLQPHEVIEPPEPTANQDGKSKEDREKDKDKSDRRSRDKKKPQPKRKDRDTRSQ